MSLIKLTTDSWVEVALDAVSCSDSRFQKMWDLHPTTHHEIMIMGKLVEIPRFQKLYGSGNYNFSGTVQVGDPDIPRLVKRCLKYAELHYPSDPLTNTIYKWNGALVNWYPDGKSYIGPHSDSTKDLVPGAPILSFSFGGVRTFRIKKIDKDLEGIEKMDFQTHSNSLIVMGGNMQKEYKHEITKTAKEVEPRINITIRCFR